MTQFFQQQRQKQSNAFFSTEGEGPSLQSYIAEHLNREPDTQPVGTPQPLPMAYAPQTPNRSGYQLNNLDVKMGAGLEQYMPTPMMRLRVTKSRLMQEIAALRAELEKYEHACAQTPRPEMKIRLGSMQNRLATLQTHEAEVTAELNQLLSYDNGLGQMMLGLGQARETMARLLAPLLEKLSPLNWLNPGRLTRMRLTQQARELQEVLAARLSDRAAPGEEIAELIQQHEQTLRALEMLTRTEPEKMARLRWLNGG